MISAARRGPTKSERTQQAILEAAEELFSEHGFDGAPLDAIGEKAGIQGTAILYHYPTKRDLYEAVIDRIYEPLLRELNAELDGSEPAEERLQAAVASMVRYSAAHPNAPRLLLRGTTLGDPDAREIMEAKTARHTRRMIEAFSKAANELDTDPLIFWNIIVGAICFYFVGSPQLAGAKAYDPRAPEHAAAFDATMRRLTGYLANLDVTSPA